jgi:hypothetical protein
MLPPRRPAAGARKKARSWADWETCSTAIADSRGDLHVSILRVTLDGAHTSLVLADLEESTREFVDLLDHAPELWDRAPAGKWSGGQHADHVANVLAVMADEFEAAERDLRADTLPPPPRRGFLQTLFVRLATRSTGLPRGARAPANVTPQSAPGRDATCARLRGEVARYRAVVDGLSDDERGRVWIRNPLTSFRWHYTLPEAICVQALHVRHHQALVEEIAGRR